MLYRILADIIALLHFAFIIFVIFGGLLVFRWRHLAWIHLPAAFWAALIEFANWYCPLTPLEYRLREAGGEEHYGAGFIEHYLTPILYPDWLTRPIQIALGLFVILINVIIYAWIFHHRQTNPQKNREAV